MRWLLLPFEESKMEPTDWKLLRIWYGRREIGEEKEKEHSYLEVQEKLWVY